MRLTTAFVALSVAIAGGLIRSGAQPQAARAHDYPVRPVPFTAVQVTDQFWAPRIEINRTVTIPFAFGKNEETGRVGNFQRAAAVLRGTSAGRPQAARLSVRRHGHLQGARRRQLHAERQAGSETLRLPRWPDRDDRRGTGEGRLPVHDAHHRPAASASLGRFLALGATRPTSVTSSTTWVTCMKPPSRITRRREALAARRRDSHSADLLDRDLRPRQADDLAGPPDHRDGPCEALSRDRRTSSYLSLAKFMLDVRGPGSLPRAGKHVQPVAGSAWSTRPRRSGHAVRATYMYSGMADVAALTGDQSLRPGHRIASGATSSSGSCM